MNMITVHGTAEQVSALFAALAAAQGEFDEVKRTATVDFRAGGHRVNFRYAPLSELYRATRPALAKHGLALLTPWASAGEAADADGVIEAVYEIAAILTHKDGGRIEAHVRFGADLARRGDTLDIKLLGALITYQRRYAINALLGLDGDPDADDVPTPGQGDEPAQTPKRSGRSGSDGPATDKQKNALRAITRSLGLKRAQIDALVRARCGVSPGAITRSQASDLIDYLKGVQDGSEDVSALIEASMGESDVEEQLREIVEPVVVPDEEVAP